MEENLQWKGFVNRSEDRSTPNLLCLNVYAVYVSAQGIQLEVENRHLELDKVADAAAELTELSGGTEQVASSVAHSRCRYDALMTAVMVSDCFCSVSNLNKLHIYIYTCNNIAT